MSKLSAQIEAIQQDSVDYVLIVLKELTRLLYRLNVPFPAILQTLAEVNAEEHCDAHATPRVVNVKSQDRWGEIYDDLHDFASDNLVDAASQLVELGMPVDDIHEFLHSCLTGVCDSCQAVRPPGGPPLTAIHATSPAKTAATPTVTPTAKRPLLVQ